MNSRGTTISSLRETTESFTYLLLCKIYLFIIFTRLSHLVSRVDKQLKIHKLVPQSAELKINSTDVYHYA